MSDRCPGRPLGYRGGLASMNDGWDAPSDPERIAQERNWLDLVARRAPGAEAAMNKLFERYQTPFKRYLRARALPEADIEDAMQRVWIDVARKAGEFRPDGIPQAWLRGFLINEMVDTLSVNAKRNGRFISANDERHAASVEQAASRQTAPSPEAIRAARDFKECVQRAFSELKRQRGIEAWWLYLRHVEDWDVKQIAERRGSTLGAARQLMSSARKVFRELLSPCLGLRTD